MDVLHVQMKQKLMFNSIIEVFYL